MECPYCGNKDIVQIFSIERMPNILAACPKDVVEYVKILPFSASLCRKCLLGFNSSRLSSEDLKFIYDNYIYISPFAGIGVSKYEPILNLIQKFCDKNDTIAEIGCSEGYLLYRLKNSGFNHIVGIEPGPQADVGRSYGLDIIKAYFGPDTYLNASVDCFIMFHVFEHFEDPFIILENIKTQMSPVGKVIIEVPYFTGYHHQHLFFYNISFLKRLLHDKGFKIIYLEREGDALRIVFTHKENPSYNEMAIQSESLYALESIATRESEKFISTIKKLNRLFESYDKIYWWGAGSSSVILLNQVNSAFLNEDKIVIIDGDKNKWGCYIPGINIPVVEPFQIENKDIDLMIIASSFFKEIIKTIEQMNVKVGKVEVFY